MLKAERNGGVSVEDGSGAEVFKVGGNGNVQTGGNWQTDSPPNFMDGIATNGLMEFNRADLTITTGSATDQFAVHSGDGELYRWFNGAGEWRRVRDPGTTMIIPS